MRRRLPFLALVLGACAGPSAAPARPSFLVVYADDLRHDGFAAAGNPYLATPHLDRVAQEGALFERSYVVTSRCCPSRASFLTGRYAHDTGVTSNHPAAPFPGEHETFVEVLDGLGYRTGWIGKWHLPNPGAAPVRGFDRFVSYEGPGQHFDETLVVDGVPLETVGFQADRLVDHAVEFLTDTGNDEPFFLTVAFKNPHVPLTPPPRHRGSLDGAGVRLPASFLDPPESLPAFYRGLRATGDTRHAIDDPAAHRADVQAYWELVPSIDEGLGRLLAALEQRGRLDDTVVVVTSDNGQLLGEHGLQQKGISYEPSIRVPLALRYPPRVAAGRRPSGFALNIDLANTLLELAGGPPLAGSPGRSLARELAGGGPTRERFVYLAPGFGDGAVVDRALVEARWKLLRIESEGRREEFLFDLVADPGERRNLARDGTHAAELARLTGALDAELERLGLR